MSSGDSLSPCTVCGGLGHWESEHLHDAEQLNIATNLLVEIYTKGYIKEKHTYDEDKLEERVANFVNK